MMAFLAAVGAATQLVSADIEIDVARGIARAEYVLITASTQFELVAMGSTTALAFDRGPVPWTLEGGLYRVVAPAVPGDSTVFRLQYRFPAGTNRVPVFVPSVPTDPKSSRVIIQVVGAAPTAGLGDTFPRFLRESDGSLVARPANVPSFVILPGERGGLYVNRVADLAVVLLLAGATGAWWFRRVRRRAST